tara:strand:- start:955 stop:1164 length:210 start_codon:yes stop_codon:yes gene_type:complete
MMAIYRSNGEAAGTYAARDFVKYRALQHKMGTYLNSTTVDRRLNKIVDAARIDRMGRDAVKGNKKHDKT